MSTPPANPDETTVASDATESQALKKLKEERAADAEQIRQDFIRSKRITVMPAAAAETKTPPETSGDER